MRELAEMLFDPSVFVHFVWDNSFNQPYRNCLVACVGILNLILRDSVLHTTTPPVNENKARWWQ
jgi:hypothetical protein